MIAVCLRGTLYDLFDTNRSSNETDASRASSGKTTLMNKETIQILLIVGVAFLVLFVVVAIAIFAAYFKLWLRAFVTKARISPLSLLFMSLRKVNPTAIVDAKIMAVQAGLKDITTEKLEAHYLAGGNIKTVIRALVVAHRARIDLNWDTASAIDLAGRNVLEAVQTSVDPKARARVTVRTNLDQLVGGATEDTIVARVGEGIVSAIGSCNTHNEVLANPMLIARTVLAKGLDSQTAYAIVSIDIADIDVGDNIGARLQADQAEADMRIARAKAEERRARAVAAEQEMKALTVENQSKVVLAEAEIPLAMADAYRSGCLRSKVSPNGPNGAI